ncbi:MAG: methylated-DNA--[protein]-cysteine S-methyltransferase [Flavobacteriales bacterium]|nr:methylated-DNA--[protein]-cysteine S-methyltransferase [Flavobacteriales bacterium]
MKRIFMESPLGKMNAEFISGELVSLAFSKEGEIELQELPLEFENLRAQLEEYFEGYRTTFDIPTNPQGTDFQKRVWEMLQEIDFNTTCSYQDLAERYGDVKAIRAIASANGSNPIAILIPCHRVVGSDGSLTGYAGGLWRKEFLLDLESGVQRLF